MFQKGKRLAAIALAAVMALSLACGKGDRRYACSFFRELLFSDGFLPMIFL